MPESPSRASLATVAALIAAAISVAGSLYLSLGMGLIACPLCFYQRTFAFADPGRPDPRRFHASPRHRIREPDGLLADGRRRARRGISHVPGRDRKADLSEGNLRDWPRPPSRAWRHSS